MIPELVLPKSGSGSAPAGYGKVKSGTNYCRKAGIKSTVLPQICRIYLAKIIVTAVAATAAAAANSA